MPQSIGGGALPGIRLKRLAFRMNRDTLIKPDTSPKTLPTNSKDIEPAVMNTRRAGSVSKQMTFPVPASLIVPALLDDKRLPTNR
tara:strand:- start:88861 stop:89115 length:255 start_codon:yes stop_codon:yes gene_type:complete